MRLINGILNKVDNIPTLPESSTRLFALLNDKNSSASDFESVIKPDPALTTNLLKVVNSSFFGLTRQVISIHQAISLLGLKRVSEIAAGVGFAQVMPPKIPGYEIDSSNFWLHCAAVAILSERMAQELKLPIPDLTFTAGLLHDLGKLVIGSFLVQESDALLKKLKEHNKPLIYIEKEILGTNHSEIGHALAERWALPEIIAESVLWHHSPEKIPEGTDPLLIDLVHIADGLAHTLGLGADVGEMARSIAPLSIKRLKITGRQLEAIASIALLEIQNMGIIFTQSSGGKN